MELRKGNKVKYAEKSILDYMKPVKTEKIYPTGNQQRLVIAEQQIGKQIINYQKTTVINVKVQNLRKNGYKNLLQWLQNPNHVYIGRHNHYVPGAIASIWANPFKVDQYGREGCIAKYQSSLENNEKLMPQLINLKGKVLGCWCVPEKCHGHVLAELADSLK